MSAAPAGAMVSIYYDGGRVRCGEALRTPTGRTYVVLDNRVQVRGKHAGRQHLACHVVKEVPPEMKVHPLRWYRRKSRRSNVR